MAEEDIRRVVREELELNLVSRTRNLIRSAASSVSRLGETLNPSSVATNSQVANNSSTNFKPSPATTQVATSSGTKRALPATLRGHWNRTKKSKPVKIQSIPKSVWLLERPSEEIEVSDAGIYEDYSITDDMVLAKGEVDLKSDQDEEAIRREIEEVLKVKFPLISCHDFEFVKRERNTICTPVVKDAHNWDFSHVKHLCGNGRLYVRLLTVDPEEISGKGKDQKKTHEARNAATNPPSDVSNKANMTNVVTGATTSASNARSSTICSKNSVHPAASTSSACCPNQHHVDDDPGDDDLLKPSGVIRLQAKEETVNVLSSMFPAIPREVIRNTVRNSYDLDSAVNHLLLYNASNTKNGSQKTHNTDRPKLETLSQVFQHLRSKMHPRGMREKIKIDADDQVMDLYTFYKDPDFDPLTPVTLCVQGQPAVDTGGVLRQMFSDVFSSLASNEVMKNVFYGEERKVPVYRNELVVNGFHEILGKMIAHSLVQGGPGFPYFSPAIYWYLATGDIQTALMKASVADVDDPDLIAYTEKVTDGSDTDIPAIAFESDFVRLMAEAGETRILTPDNKFDVMQSLMLHNIIVKKKSILDQLRKGLSILGLLEEIERNPQMFEECFVPQGEVSSKSVTDCLAFEPAGDKQTQRIYQMLLNFIKGCSNEQLCDFLRYITGSISCILPRKIRVSIENGSGSIYASTCLMELKLPSTFETYEAFEVALKSVIQGKNFTTA